MAKRPCAKKPVVQQPPLPELETQAIMDANREELELPRKRGRQPGEATHVSRVRHRQAGAQKNNEEEEPRSPSSITAAPPSLATSSKMPSKEVHTFSCSKQSEPVTQPLLDSDSDAPPEVTTPATSEDTSGGRRPLGAAALSRRRTDSLSSSTGTTPAEAQPKLANCSLATRSDRSSHEASSMVRPQASIHVTELNLSFALRDVRAIKEKVALFASGTIATSLISLKLSFNPFPAPLMRELVPGLQKLKSLQTVVFSNCELFAPAMKVLAPALGEMPSLQSLNLCSNNLDDSAMKFLCTALVSLPCLRVLDLSSNFFRIDAMKHLARTLREIPSLQVLRLASNRLEGAAMNALGPALRELTSLQELDFDSNQLGAHGITSLSCALATMTSLQKLLLGRNQLHDDAMYVLIPALRKLKSLEVLDLRNNLFSSDAIELLVSDALYKMTSLRVIDIGTPLTAAVMPALATVVLNRLPFIESVLGEMPQVSGSGWMILPRPVELLPEMRAAVGVQWLRVSGPFWHQCVCPLPCCNGNGTNPPGESGEHFCRLHWFVTTYPGVGMFTKTPAAADTSQQQEEEESRVDFSLAASFKGCHGDFFRGAAWLQAADLTPLENWCTVGDGFLRDCSSLQSVTL